MTDAHEPSETERNNPSFIPDGWLRCSGCLNIFSKERFATSQRNRGENRKCGDCLSGTWAEVLSAQRAPPTPLLHPEELSAQRAPPTPLLHPSKPKAKVLVAHLIQLVISTEQRDDFWEWIDTAEEVLKRIGESTNHYTSAYTLLLDAYPDFKELCRTYIDPVTRLYPLQRAIKSGIEWEKGTRQIYEACTAVVGFPDPNTGLFPFQVAAELGHLDLSYHLLKAQATIIKEPIRDPNVYYVEPPLLSIFREQSGQSTVYVYSSDEEFDEPVDNEEDS